MVAYHVDDESIENFVKDLPIKIFTDRNCFKRIAKYFNYDEDESLPIILLETEHYNINALFKDFAGIILVDDNREPSDYIIGEYKCGLVLAETLHLYLEQKVCEPEPLWNPEEHI